jgi:hypothetical protein
VWYTSSLLALVTAEGNAGARGVASGSQHRHAAPPLPCAATDLLVCLFLREFPRYADRVSRAARP